MKNLRFYNELEYESGNGKPDKYDGKWRMNGGQFALIDPNTSAIVASGTAKETVFSFGYEKYPVFCFFVVTNVIVENTELIEMPVLFLFRSLASKYRN